MSVIQGAQIAGASAILAVDPIPAKRALAQSFGATHVAHPDQIDEARVEVTGGKGFDFAFECVGRGAVIRQAWDNTANGGTTVVVGAGGADDIVPFSASELFRHARTLKGSLYGGANPRSDFDRLLRLWRAGRLDLERMISRRCSLGDINDAIAAVEQGELIRCVIEFQGG